MVDAPQPTTGPSSAPFAFRSTIYTILFLLVILGVIPSIFYVCGELISGSHGFWQLAWSFWSGFRVLVGVSLFAIGLAAYSYCSAWLIFFGKGPHVEFDPPKVFVASGPYRWVRNPVVITLLLTVVGEAIWFGSIPILILVIVGLPLAHYQVTRIEEPRLKARFGASYEEYCGRVSRWTPHFPHD